MIDLKAIPTEYSRTLFRSKTEAVFARALDLAGIWWEYEPEQWRHKSGWVPDFKMASRFYSSGKWVIQLWCAELKPSPPTGAYYDRLERMLSDISRELHGVVESLIVGSPFNENVTRSINIRGPDGWQVLDGKVNERIFGFWDEALHYRFDLEHV